MKKNILEILDERALVGDGGCISDILEKRQFIGNEEIMSVISKRGILKTDEYVNTCSEEDVIKLLGSFIESGADVIQSFNRPCEDNPEYVEYDIINNTTCVLSSEVSGNANVLLAGGLSQTSVFLDDRDEDIVKDIFRKQCDVFSNNNVDFMIVEHFDHVQECEWAIEVAKEVVGCPVMSMVCVNDDGDLDGITCEVCSVRMVQSGADIIGVNCNNGPRQGLNLLSKMKEGLKENGILENVYLAFHPLVYMISNDVDESDVPSRDNRIGFQGTLCTIDELRELVRDAYDLGVRYIGGCYGFDPVHIKVLSDELKLKSDIRS